MILRKAPSDILDFNTSMLSREDYGQMVAERTTYKSARTDDVDEQLSCHEQAIAITLLLYGLLVLKAATPAQQHDMFCRLQPSLVFEMMTLLLEIDTAKLLTLGVDDDALHDKAAKDARA